MNIQTVFTKPSTYTALLVWGATGFMAQPSIASFIVHFLVAPILIILTLWLAHHEAKAS